MEAISRQLVPLEFVRPVTAFKDTKELITVFRQALETHRCLHEQAQILHRDISARNIVITSAGNGTLADWDLSNNQTLERIGTWQFMAARLVVNPRERLTPNFIDDLESFWHTLLYITLCHCDHDWNVGRISSTFKIVHDFAMFKVRSGTLIGSQNKEPTLWSQRDTLDMGIRSPPLEYVLLESLTVVRTRGFQSSRAMKTVEEIARLKKEYDGDDFERSLKTDHKELYDESGQNAWGEMQILFTPRWMEKIFDAVLDDPHSVWDQGEKNVQRELRGYLRQSIHYA